jgi:DNA polymerase-3 subunit epsilon
VPSIGQETRTVVLLETETTGLDSRKGEIFELGMVKFDHLPDGRIAGIQDTFSGSTNRSAGSCRGRSPASPTRWSLAAG